MLLGQEVQQTKQCFCDCTGHYILYTHACVGHSWAQNLCNEKARVCGTSTDSDKMSFGQI